MPDGTTNGTANLVLPSEKKLHKKRQTLLSGPTGLLSSSPIVWGLPFHQSYKMTGISRLMRTLDSEAEKKKKIKKIMSKCNLKQPITAVSEKQTDMCNEV